MYTGSEGDGARDMYGEPPHGRRGRRKDRPAATSPTHHDEHTSSDWDEINRMSMHIMEIARKEMVSTRHRRSHGGGNEDDDVAQVAQTPGHHHHVHDLVRVKQDAMDALAHMRALMQSTNKEPHHITSAHTQNTAQDHEQDTPTSTSTPFRIPNNKDEIARTTATSSPIIIPTHLPPSMASSHTHIPTSLAPLPRSIPPAVASSSPPALSFVQEEELRDPNEANIRQGMMQGCTTDITTRIVIPQATVFPPCTNLTMPLPAHMIEASTHKQISSEFTQHGANPNIIHHATVPYVHQ
eukprot:TRINITY_DN1510_c0_g1_i1.p1 TRINITY_DN1510_c0_g1~~TRINITY_DN1510_c0_g1_i1.p1  ORF type:complete len:296 (-),score=64.71 TRINITY_DN1510_c0_g1_i1:139-1026(-)